MTLGTFIAVLFPFLKGPLLWQLFTRVFPFNRGLFEDKVANFWCVSDVLLIKWREIPFIGRTDLVRLSAVLTIFSCIPSSWLLIKGAWDQRISLQPVSAQGSNGGATAPTESRCPTLPLLPYALYTTSMAFFLLSFQVHEKSILLPLMPLTLLMSSSTPGSVTWNWGLLVNNVAVFRQAFAFAVHLSNFNTCDV